MASIVTKYNNSQEGCYILGRLTATNIDFTHLYKERIFKVRITDRDDEEEVKAILADLEWWKPEFYRMAQLDMEE